MFDEIFEIELSNEEAYDIFSGWGSFELNGSRWEAFKEETCNYENHGKWSYFDIVFNVVAPDSKTGELKKHYYMLDVEEKEGMDGESEYTVGTIAIKVVQQEVVTHTWKMAQHA